MEIKVALSLPGEAVSIPVVRHICAHSLRVLGVRQGCIDDVEVALSEACSNVLRHARVDHAYEVSAGVDQHVAVIEVVDTGGGFDPADVVGPPDDDQTGESGRGIQLMRALMDSVLFEVTDGPRPGTRVHLEKRLEWEDGALIDRLGTTALERGPWTGESRLDGHRLDGDRLDGDRTNGSAPQL